MSKYGLHGCLRAKTGKGEALAKILIRASELMKKISSCHLYLISRDPKDPEDIYVTEVWDSKEDHDASLSIQEVRELITEAMPLLDGQPAGGQSLEFLGGKGLD